MSEDPRKKECVKKIRLCLVKLKYLYDIQDRDIWYMNVVKLGKDEVRLINDDYSKVFTNDLYNIGLNLGSTLSGKELTVELYKFNESLTRLLSQQSNLPRDPSMEFLNGDLRTINSDEETIHDQGATRLKIDSTLLIKTIIKLLILKLSKIIEILSSSQVKLSNIEHKLIDDILMKNISNRILKPYHNLIHLKTGSIMSNVY